MENILISVILPAYNAEKNIYEAIESILAQSHKNFELLILNDGSTDNTEKIISSFRDKRIVYIKNKVNRGLIFTLNRGLALAKGDFIARMDADDISLPTRFYEQITVLNSDSNIIVCGTAISYLGAHDRTPYRIYSDNITLKKWLVRESCFAHPTVMIRKCVLDENKIEYDTDYKDAEDYKMWIDLSNYGSFYNISKALVKYRISDSQISQENNLIQKNNAKKCRRYYINKLYPNLFISDEVTLADIKRVKKIVRDNEFLLDVLYLSLNKYSFSELIYFAISFDWLKLNVFSNLAIIKRFINGKNPLL